MSFLELSDLLRLIVTQGEGALALMKAEKVSDLLRKMVESNAQRTCVIIQGFIHHGASVGLTLPTPCS